MEPTRPGKAVRWEIGRDVIDLTQPESLEEVEEELSSQIPMPLHLGDFYSTPDGGSIEHPESISNDSSMNVTDLEIDGLIEKWFN